MKKFTALFLAVLMTAFLGAFCTSAAESDVLPKASEWEYLTYEGTAEDIPADIPSGWLEGTDYGATKAQAPFAAPTYAKDITNTKFAYQYFAAYLRTTFTVEKASDVTTLMMYVIYDENPVVYINGEEVWSAEGYKDTDYIAVDLSEKISILKNGTNTVCVYFENVVGGALYDMALSTQAQPKVDENGKVSISSVTTTGFSNFGSVNAPENILDMDQDTCTGSTFDAGKEQSVTMNFVGKTSISEIFVQCKDEGITTNDDGSRGTYDIYAYNGEIETKLGSIKAFTGTDGGATLKLEEPVEADSIKIVITSWQGDKWACVADAYVVAAEESNPPVNPPAGGEHTALIVALAAIALFGTAFAVTKARKEF